jgi:hypothetical protein
MTDRLTVPIYAVFLPMLGSVLFKFVPRVLGWAGDSPIGLSWVGTIELVGLAVGAVTAAVVIFGRR